ncbi:MAG TPA: hypothetical protein VMK13_17250, partial [Streptosporangiaceae bacterium]|nr:hypothetical protein [Streptosporangiaceae bacterium]
MTPAPACGRPALSRLSAARAVAPGPRLAAFVVRAAACGLRPLGADLLTWPPWHGTPWSATCTTHRLAAPD